MVVEIAAVVEKEVVDEKAVVDVAVVAGSGWPETVFNVDSLSWLSLYWECCKPRHLPCCCGGGRFFMVVFLIDFIASTFLLQPL